MKQAHKGRPYKENVSSTAHPTFSRWEREKVALIAESH